MRPIRVIQIEGISVLMLAGLYAVTFLSVAMGALLGADTLAGEISSGTIQTIVTKPVRRSDVVLGKWLGFAMLLALYSMLMSGGTVLSVWIQSGYTPPNLLTGLVVDLSGNPVDDDHLAGFFQRHPRAGNRRSGLWFVRLAFIGGWIEQIGALFKIRLPSRLAS